MKIDRACVAQLTKSPEAHSAVKSVISTAHGLKLKVVAEGVETATELGLLRDLDCDQVQGYHTGRPVPSEDFRKRLAAKTTVAA